MRVRILIYCRSGNIREVLIFANFARRINSRIQDSRENYYYNSACKKNEYSPILNFVKSTKIIKSLNSRILQKYYYNSATIKKRVRFTLNSSTGIIEFRGFFSKFSTNFHKILPTLFSIHVVTTLEISQSFDDYLRS